MVQLQIPSQLRTHTQGQSTLEVEGGRSVQAILDGLAEEYSGLTGFLLGSRGMNRHVNIYLGDEDIRFLEGLETEVPDKSELIIVPAVSGGQSSS